MKKIILSLTIIAGLTSCANTDAKDSSLNNQIESQAPADTPQAIVERAASTFSNVEGINAKQRSRLSEIYTQVYFESTKIRREMGQAKSLLFQTLAKPEYKESDITKLKKKIISLDQKRLNLMFKALDDVQAVVGKGVTNADKIYQHFQDYEIPSRYMKDYKTQ